MRWNGKAFFFVAVVATFALYIKLSNKQRNSSSSAIDDFAFSSSNVMNGSWRNMITFDSRLLSNRVQRERGIIDLGNMDDVIRKRKGRGNNEDDEDDDDDKEEEEKVPLLNTNTLAYEERR